MPDTSADSLRKGDRAVVIGRLKSRAWQTADGENRTVVEIEADEVAVSLRWAIAKPERTNGRKPAESPASGKTSKARPKRGTKHTSTTAAGANAEPF